MAVRRIPIFPQVISDLNFYHVSSRTNLKYKLITLQRVALAAVGAYLFYRYHPLMTSRVSHIPYASQVVSAVCFLISYTLCAPAAFLVQGCNYLYQGSVDIISGDRHKVIERVAIGVWKLAGGYVVCQVYRSYKFCFFPSPNLIDRFFIRRIAEKNASRLWLRFYAKFNP